MDDGSKNQISSLLIAELDVGTWTNDVVVPLRKWVRDYCMGCPSGKNWRKELDTIIDAILEETPSKKESDTDK